MNESAAHDLQLTELALLADVRQSISWFQRAIEQGPDNAVTASSLCTSQS